MSGHCGTDKESFLLRTDGRQARKKTVKDDAMAGSGDIIEDVSDEEMKKRAKEFQKQEA